MRPTRIPTASILTLIAALVLAAVPIPSEAAQELPRVRPEDVGMSSERLGRLTDAFHRYVDEGRLPGAVVLVARDGKVPYFEAFGLRDVESGAPMTRDAIFRVASQTKAVVSVAVMMLQEEGRLQIVDDAGWYLPGLMETTVAVPVEGGGYEVEDAGRRITIRDLLTHTAGVGYGNGPAREAWDSAGVQGWYFADRDEPIAATVERIAGLPFDAQPGERWVYGYSTDILGALVERVSGMPLDDFLRSRVFEPLGMRDTRFYLAPRDRGRLATVYSSLEIGTFERAPDPGGMVGQGAYGEGPRASFSGGAGLLSTATDYARFLQMLLNGGELDGVRLLSPKTVELMTTDHVGDLFGAPGEGFGLGFRVLEDLGERGQPGSVGEYGWGGAYHSTYWVDPAERLVVVYMTQLIPARLDDHAKLRALVYQAIVEAGAPRAPVSSLRPSPARAPG